MTSPTASLAGSGLSQSSPYPPIKPPINPLLRVVVRKRAARSLFPPQRLCAPKLAIPSELSSEPSFWLPRLSMASVKNESRMSQPAMTYAQPVYSAVAARSMSLNVYSPTATLSVPYNCMPKPRLEEVDFQWPRRRGSSGPNDESPRNTRYHRF